MEGPEVAHEFVDLFHKTERKAPKWVKAVASVGWLLIVLGVAGEGYFDSKVSDADTMLQSFNTSLVKDAQLESAGAERYAADAILFAGNASNSAERANKSALQAESHLAEAEKQAAAAERDAKNELLARLKIEKQIAPRSLTQEQKDSITAALKPLGPQKIDLFLYPNDPEILGIAKQIAESMPGWQFKVFEPLAGGGISGILIEFDPKDPSARRRAVTLLAALTGCDLKVEGPVPSLPTPPNLLPAYLGARPVDSTIRMTVGKK